MRRPTSVSLYALSLALAAAAFVPPMPSALADDRAPSDKAAPTAGKADGDARHDGDAGEKKSAPSFAGTAAPNLLPAASITQHELHIGSTTLHFTAKAGAIRLNNGSSGKPIADLSYVAFIRDGTEKTKRPITIAINGGPGASSAWLNLGGLGPWRLPLDGARPSAAPITVDNAETWLDFTDLVFIDPPGTGFSRLYDGDDEARKQFYAVRGDIDALSVAIRKWLVENDRLLSPKFIVGESYGGFRAPKLARRLEDSEGIGISGLVMISPVLDFGWFESNNSPLGYVTHLPSMAATARGLKGTDDRKALADVEAYARGPYVVDLLHGERDPAALARVTDQVAAFTGLDKKLVERLGGRIDIQTFARERRREHDEVTSLYDGLAVGLDAEPHAANNGSQPDPVLDGLKTPLASAMTEITTNRLKWPIEARYEILNASVSRQWDWGNRSQAEALSDLKTYLSLDPKAHVLIAHGLTDEVTPYFASQLLIDQVPAYGDASRLKLAVYGGGHMIYANDGSRAALRDDARKIIGPD